MDTVTFGNITWNLFDFCALVCGIAFGILVIAFEIDNKNKAKSKKRKNNNAKRRNSKR